MIIDRTHHPLFRHTKSRSLVGLFLSGAVVVAGAGCQSLDGYRKGRGPQAKSPDAPAQVPGEIRPLPKPPLPSDEVVAGKDSVDRAKVLADQGMTDNAIKELEKAIAENPLLTGAYMAMGDLQIKKGNLDKAENNFAKAASLEPRNFSAQFMHALVLQELNRLNEAIRAYLRALNLRPDDFQANANIGTAYLQAGEPQNALAYSKRAVELKPQDGAARANLGVVYQQLNRHEEAITEFQQAAELVELSPELLTNLADSYGRTQRYEEMVATLEQVVAMKPSATALERLGSGQFRLGLYDEALASFQACVKLEETHYPGHNGIGVCQLHKWISGGKSDPLLRDSGLRSLRRSLQIEKNQPKVMELLGRFR
jgi:tetratricopeptide (TPR) repeat protein